MRHGFIDGERRRLSPEAWRGVLSRLTVALLIICAGYAVAVTIATFVTVAHLALPTVLPDDGHFGSFYGFMRDWPMLLLGGLMMTGTAGLPGFIFVVLWASWQEWRDAVRFTLAGAGNALFALWLQGGFSGNEKFLVFCAVGGGLAGGFGYWLTAERWRANLRERMAALAASLPQRA